MILKSLNYFPVCFQALDLRPGDKGCLVARSQCHLELGNADAALTDAEATLEDNKEFIQVCMPSLPWEVWDKVDYEVLIMELL